MPSQRHIWTGWVLPVVLGASAGLAARRLYADRDLAVAPGVRPTPHQRGAPPRVPEPSRSNHPDSGRVDRNAGDSEGESLDGVLAEIIRLEQRIDELDGGSFLCRDGSCDGWFEPNAETLEAWAACAQLPVDVPAALLRADGPWLSDAGLQKVDASPEEREALDLAMDAFDRQLHARFVSLHEDIVGTGRVADRSTHSLLAELRAFQAVSDPDGLDRKLVARERAGQTPQEERGSGEMVPYYRELLRLGDDLERNVAVVLGQERASALRRTGNGWGARLGSPPICE
jgi:hypothetical protein